MKIKVFTDTSILWRDSGTKLALNKSDLFVLKDIRLIQKYQREIIKDGYVVVYAHGRHVRQINQIVKGSISQVKLILWTNDWVPLKFLEGMPNCYYLAPFKIKEKNKFSNIKFKHVTQPGHAFDSEMIFEDCDVAFYGTLGWDIPQHNHRNEVVKKILENTYSKIFFKRSDDNTPISRGSFDFKILVESQSNAYRSAKFSICASQNQEVVTHCQSNRLFNIMASGGCPLVWRNEGVEDFIQDGLNGRIFDTPEHALEIINKTTRSESDRMKKESFSSFKKKHTVEVLYSQLKEIIDS